MLVSESCMVFHGETSQFSFAWMRPAAEDAFESFAHFTRQQLNLQKEVVDSCGDGWLEGVFDVS